MSKIRNDLQNMQSPEDAVLKLLHIFINDRPLTLSQKEYRIITDKDINELTFHIMECLQLQSKDNNNYHDKHNDKSIKIQQSMKY